MFGFGRSYSLSCVHTLPAHRSLTTSDSIRLAQVVNGYPEVAEERPQLKLVYSSENTKEQDNKKK